MKSRFLLAMASISLIFLLYGCGTVEASRIYTVCKVTESSTFVYDANGNFYTYADGKVTPVYSSELKALPMLVLRFDDVTEYTLVPEIPTVYLGTKEDALHYATRVLTECSGVYRLPHIDWKSFEMLISTDTCDMRILYTSDDKVRIYAVDKDGESILPPFLEE